MAQPIEIGFYMRRITLEELTAGVQPVRQQINGETVLMHPPLLRYRWREKGDNGVVWSDWARVDYVREGDDQP